MSFRIEIVWSEFLYMITGPEVNKIPASSIVLRLIRPVRTQIKNQTSMFSLLSLMIAFATSPGKDHRTPSRDRNKTWQWNVPDLFVPFKT